MKIYSFAVLLLFFAMSTSCLAQGYLKTDYLFSSSLKDEEGNTFGSGDLIKTSAGFNLPLSVKKNSLGQVKAWSATLNGSYGVLNNKDITAIVNPEEIVNVTLSVAHIRPLSERWYLIASLGAGIYSEPNSITAKSILASGGVIFVYKVRNNLDLGIGVGLTNSFGVPIIMPMAYVKWQLTGKYEVTADIANGVEVSGSVKLGKRFRVKLTAIEMDGMSAVMNIDDKSMIYASAIIKSHLTPELRIGKSSTFYLGGGGAWARSVKLSKRSFKGFLNTFKEDNDLNFRPTGYLTVGFRYGF